MGNIFKARASSAGKLMVSGNDISVADLAKIAEYESRKAGTYLTPSGKVGAFSTTMQSSLAELIVKRDAPFELGDTAKSFVFDEWLKANYRYDKPVVVDTMLKGHLCEQDSIRLIQKLVPAKEFRVKNQQHFEDEFFTGTPDIILKDWVEDAKSCWTVKTFAKAKPSDLYFTQAQVYMHLTGRKKYRLCYCLVDTPEELIEAEKRKYFYKFGGFEDNPHYQEVCKKIDDIHRVEWIPEKDRLKIYTFTYDAGHINELKKRVKHARKYYNSLSLKSGEQVA